MNVITSSLMLSIPRSNGGATISHYVKLLMNVLARVVLILERWNGMGIDKRTAPGSLPSTTPLVMVRAAASGFSIPINERSQRAMRALDGLVVMIDHLKRRFGHNFPPSYSAVDQNRSRVRRHDCQQFAKRSSPLQMQLAMVSSLEQKFLRGMRLCLERKKRNSPFDIGQTTMVTNHRSLHMFARRFNKH